MDRYSIGFLRKKLHDKILDLRALERVLSGPLFVRLYEDSTPEDQIKLLTIADDKKAIMKWIRLHPSKDISEYNIVDLRNLGRKYGVVNYCRLTKWELITEIKKIEAADLKAEDDPS